MIWVKVIAGLLVLAAIAGAVSWISSTLEKAQGYDQALERVSQVEQEKAELASKFAEAQLADTAIADELRAFRAEQQTSSAEFRRQLAQAKISREVRHEPNPDGTCPPTRERDPVEYRRLYNDAVGAPYP